MGPAVAAGLTLLGVSFDYRLTEDSLAAKP
jgi:hypothetical protein